MKRQSTESTTASGRERKRTVSGIEVARLYRVAEARRRDMQRTEAKIAMAQKQLVRQKRELAEAERAYAAAEQVFDEETTTAGY